jgi:asparagine synthase (glutamine-hydrolysing)
MCGIVGIVGGEIDRAALVAMRDRLTHRGPDDAGVEVWPEDEVGLAHRRLAIISPVPEGRQPMSNGDGTVWLTFNGEIYNYRELREELRGLGHHFRTETDSEVLLMAYQAWGVEALERIDGMFAFAVWDRPHKRLLLARDRLGIKPLYYAVDGGRFVFASEPKAILAHPDLNPRVDERALLDYLSYGYVPEPRCIFRGLHKLEAGHMMVIENGAMTRSRPYWTLEPGDWLEDRDDARSQVREHIDAAVRAQLVSDVPIGAFLSGGIDSSAVTASAALVRPGVRTFSVGFDDGDSELPYARQLAERYGTDHAEAVVGVTDAADIGSTLARFYDEPFADTSAIPTYLLCARGRRHVKVALSGDGGDELFAGYRWYAQQLGRPTPPAWVGRLTRRVFDRVRGLPRAARVPALQRRFEANPIERHFLYMQLFDSWEQLNLAGPGLDRAASEHDSLGLFRTHFRADLPLLTALQYLDLKTFLVDDILVKVDRASMASSLEVRPPLLDHRLVELAFRIPPHWQLEHGRGKSLLTAAVADRLPEEIRERPKRGFSAPVTRWFRGGLWEACRERLVGGRLIEDGLIDRTFVDWMVRNYTERRWAKVWSLLALEEWYRRWIRGES